MHFARRCVVLVAVAVGATPFCAHLVDASWAVTTANTGSTFATGSIAAPTGPTATALLLTNAVQLSWTPPVAAQQGTGTRIDRNVGAGAYTTLTTITPGSVATYTDAGLTTATVYCYTFTTVASLWTAGPTVPVCATAT